MQYDAIDDRQIASDPSPEEIRRRSEELQAQWSAQRERSRCVLGPARADTAIVATAQLGRRDASRRRA